MIIIVSAELPKKAPPKPPSFPGTDEDWNILNNVDQDSDLKPDWEENKQIVNTNTEIPSVEQIEENPLQQPTIPVTPQPLTPQIQQTTVTEPPIITEAPDQLEIPESIGQEGDWEVEKVPTSMPVATPENPPTELSGEDPIKSKPELSGDFWKIKPKEEIEPVDPAELFEEVLPADTPLEEQNKKLSVRQKIWYALNNGINLTVNYDTIGKNNKPSVNINRRISPQYVAYNNGTNRFLLFAQPDPNYPAEFGPNEGDGWKSFAVDNIQQANLEE